MSVEDDDIKIENLEAKLKLVKKVLKDMLDALKELKAPRSVWRPKSRETENRH